jgi:hypothetical protein
MSQHISSDAEWLKWIEVQKRATRSWLTGNISDAISLVTSYVESGPPLDLKRQAVGFRGSLHQEAGNLEEAKSSFVVALELSDTFDFERATLEESIAAISMQLGDANQAGTWYLRAIETARRDPLALNAASLLRFLAIREPMGLSRVEQELIEEVILAAWTFYRLPGHPNLSDLRSCVDLLGEAQEKPRRPE